MSPLDASPARSRRTLMLLGIAAWASVLTALLLALFVAREADAAMGGQLQRIFYFHVPSAWVSYLAFGVVFCSLVLVTGPIWARPVWGTWWQWDARLPSPLVLWLTYIGYLFVRT